MFRYRLKIKVCDAIRAEKVVRRKLRNIQMRIEEERLFTSTTVIVMSEKDIRPRLDNWRLSAESPDNVCGCGQLISFRVLTQGVTLNGAVRD